MLSALQRLTERAKDTAAILGGQSGLLCREFKGKDGEKKIYRVDPCLMTLLAELRAQERQAAKQLGQRVEKREEAPILVRGVNDGTDYE